MKIYTNLNISAHKSVIIRKGTSAVSFDGLLTKNTGSLALQYLIKKKKYTPTSLGKELELSRATIGQVASGTRVLTDAQLMKLEEFIIKLPGDILSLFNYKKGETTEGMAKRLELTIPKTMLNDPSIKIKH